MKKLSDILKEDVLGKDEPIKLSDIPNAQTAKAVWQAGPVDGDDGDDKANTKSSTTVQVGALKPMQKEVIPDKALAFALGYFLYKYALRFISRRFVRLLIWLLKLMK